MEHGSITSQPSPTEKTQPPPALSSQAKCRDGGFAAFGFENQDECTKFFVGLGARKSPATRTG
jgi:hypothetical protein